MSTAKPDEVKTGDVKATPKKPVDRKRPFARINNEASIPPARPDGFGKACGCHTPDEFEDFEKEFLKFLETDAPVFKTLLDILDAVKKIARAVSEAANIAQFTPLFPIAVVVKAIADVTNIVVTAIDTALRGFLAVLAKRIFRRAVRVLPQWVPVKRGSPKATITPDQVIEVEGVVTRSFGNPIEVPFLQWHRWFNWNVQIKPDDKYKNARSPADDPPNQEGWEGARSLFRPECFEIQMDVGALWHPGGEQAAKLKAGLSKKEVEAGVIEDVDWPPKFIDFCWPSTDMRVWASGRWVYDCSRTTSVKKDDKDAQPQMVAMINPCKAIATARFKAFKFFQNEFSVPAIQFMFFINKRGGYVGYDTISDKDYEFILDLPPIDFKGAPFPIGATPKFPHNTIVVRPRLLHKIDKGMFEQFMGAVGSTKEERDKKSSPDPILTLIQSENPSDPPKQIKVTIPCTKLGNAEAYGFILSLGWHDPLLEQARKVKECTMKVSQFTGAIQVRDSGIKKLRAIFKEEEPKLRKQIADAVATEVAKITVLGIPILQVPILGQFVKDLIAKMIDEALKGFLDLLEKHLKLESEEWLLRVGINGAWERVYVHNVPAATTNPNPAARLFIPKPLPHPIDFTDFRLEEDESLRISAHGMEFDPVGDMMWSSHDNRTLKLDDKPVQWADICDPPGDAEAAQALRRRMAMKYTMELMVDSTSTAFALGLDNSPLGIVDPEDGKSGPFPISNPVELKTAAPGFPDGLQKALFARAVDVVPNDANPNQDQMILVERTDKDDYEIFYTLNIKNQVPDKT